MSLSKREFCERFVAYMVKNAPFTCFLDEDGNEDETVVAGLRSARFRVAGRTSRAVPHLSDDHHPKDNK